MACNAEDEEESLQDNFFKQRLKYMGAGGFSRVRGFGNVTWDRRRPAHHSRLTDTGGENFFKTERYSYNHKPVSYSEGSVYNAKSLPYNADKVRFSEDRKRHATPSFLRWNRSPVTRHNENSNIYEYNQTAERDVGADSSKINRRRHYLSRWKGKSSSAKKIKEMSKEHEHDRSTDKDEKKWREKKSPRQRLVGVSNYDQSSEIKRRKLDKDSKDQTHFSYSRRYRRNLKPVQIGKNNTQHYNHDIEIAKNCRIVIEFEGLSKEKVVVKRTDGKEASYSDSQLENKIKNSTAGMLDSKPHDPLRAKDETVSICEKFENNTISVENAKTLTGAPSSEKELSSTSLLELTSGIQKTTAYSVQKNIEIESFSQIEEQSSFCVVKDKDKVQLSKDKLHFSHTSNMTQLTAEDDRIADLDDVTLAEKLCTVSNPIGMDRDSHQKNINDSQSKAVVTSPNSEKCRFTKEHSEKNKVSIVKLGKSELGERDKIIKQNSCEKDKVSCIEFSGAKQLKRRKSDETFNRSKHNLLNKGFMSNVNSKESKTTDTIVNKNQGNLFDSFHYFTLPFKSSQDEHNDNHRKCEAICFNVARSTTIGHSQEKSCAKMDGKKSDLMYSGEKTKICIENTVDKTNMDSSSTKTETNENNEIEDDEQHPKHEKGSESNAIADRSINDLRDLNLDKQRHIQHKKVKVNHKHLKCTLKSKKLKSAKQTLMISSKLFKKVNTPSEMEVTNEKKWESCKSKKSQEENKKRINPTRKIKPSYISGSDKENVDVKRTDDVHSIEQDKLIEECMQIQPVKKVNLDVENVTLNKEINLLQGSKVLEAVQAKELRQNRNLKVDNVENDDEEDYTIIDLNIAPATPCPMTPGLSTEVVASLQEYEDCEMDKEKSSGLTPDSVCNMQTPDTKIKGPAAYLLQFIYNPDISDISEDDNGDQHSSTQNSHKDEVKDELQEDAIKTKFKRQQPNKEERRMRMERLEEAYMQLTVDAANGKGKKRPVSKKKRKDKEQHYKTKQKSTSEISEISISFDKTPTKKKSKNSKSKSLSADKGKCLRYGKLANTPDEIKDSLMCSQLIDLSKDEKSVTELVVANSLISQEAGEIQQRKDKGSLDANEDSSKNLNDLFLHHCINTSEKVVNDMKNVDNSETEVESSELRLSPRKVAVSDLKATQNYSDESTDEAKSITAAERSDALAHHQIWQNGFEFVHDLILMDGRKITTKGHIEPKLMNEKEKNIIRCQVCEKYMTPRSFMYHHDNSNIIKQIDIKRSVSNPPKPDPEDIIIWNSGAGDIWECFLKEISIVDHFGKDRHTTRMNSEMRNLQAAGLCLGSSINTIIGENIQLPFGDDQRLDSTGNAIDNLQISSSCAQGFIALPAATSKYSSGAAKSCQIVSKQAQEKRLRDRSENSHPCRALTNKSGFTVHHLSDNNFSCTSKPNASVGIVQDEHNCNLQGYIYLQSSGNEEPMKQESSLISIRHEQMQNQLKIESLQTNILALLGKSTNNSMNTATSASDGRDKLRNNPTRQLDEHAVADCAEKWQLHGDGYGQQDVSDTHTYGQYAVGPEFIVSQARNCHQVANDQIKRDTVSSHSCPHRSVQSPIEKIYCAPSPVVMRVYNVSSVSHDDRSGDQNGETHSSNLLYNSPVTNNKLAISSASCTVVGNQSVPIKNILSTLDNEKSELHLMANKKLSVNSTSKENSMGFATGFETSIDQIASSEPRGTPSVGISSTNQSSSEEASSGNVNTKNSEPKAGPSNLPVTASAKTICALDKLIDEIDFRNVAALVAELTSTVQRLHHTNDTGKS